MCGWKSCMNIKLVWALTCLTVLEITKFVFDYQIFFKVYAINEMYLYIQEIKPTLQWNVWGNEKINKLNTSPEGTC